jgi:hypothetical protein
MIVIMRPPACVDVRQLPATGCLDSEHFVWRAFKDTSHKQAVHCRIVAVLKLLKMARSVRALLDTVMQALPEVGNLGLLFFLLFYIFAALGVELFGRVGEFLSTTNSLLLLPSPRAFVSSNSV